MGRGRMGEGEDEGDGKSREKDAGKRTRYYNKLPCNILWVP